MLIYFLPMIIIVGILTSYGDIRIGKIRNKWVLMGLIYAFVVNFIIILYAYLSINFNINNHYLFEMATNFIFTVLAGFLLWYFNIWTAGDGKLFITFAALIPISVYSLGYVEWIPSAILLINIFVVSFVVMIGYMAFRFRKLNFRGIIKPLLKEVFQPLQLFDAAIGLFAIIWLMQKVFELIGFGGNIILLVIVSMAVMVYINNKFQEKTRKIMITIAVFRLVIDKSVYSLDFVLQFSLIILLWIIIRSFISEVIIKLSQDAFSTEIGITELKPGMSLSETIEEHKSLSDENLAKLKKSPIMRVTEHNGRFYVQKPKSAFGGQDYIEEESEGVTQEQINIIKKIGIKNIKVGQTIPFAPFIFLGVILTLIAKGNILVPLFRLFV